MEYKTTQRFLETFGLKNLSDLPSLRSLQMKPEDQEQMAQALASLNGELPEEEPLTAADLAFADPNHGENENFEAAEPVLEAAEPVLEAAEPVLEAAELNDEIELQTEEVVQDP